MFTSTIIGLGQIGLMYDFDSKRTSTGSHAKAYKQCPHIDLVAASDVKLEQKNYLEQVSQKTIFYLDYLEMLKVHKPDIVSICSPPAGHYDQIISILSDYSPKIILCEKPVVANLMQARKVLELFSQSKTQLIPNLSRRWLTGMIRIKQAIASGIYGNLQKIHIRYTRGIYNTGAHIVDMVHWLAGEIEEVKVINQVSTSSDQDHDPSYTFYFKVNDHITGYAEAYNDRQYYMFEFDLYLEDGKIEIRDSGDIVNYYKVTDHRLFSGFKGLNLLHTETGLLRESSMENAINHLADVLLGVCQPQCTLWDGVYPLFVANALDMSYKENRLVKVRTGTHE